MPEDTLVYVFGLPGSAGSGIFRDPPWLRSSAG